MASVVRNVDNVSNVCVLDEMSIAIVVECLDEAAPLLANIEVAAEPLEPRPARDRANVIEGLLAGPFACDALVGGYGGVDCLVCPVEITQVGR